VTATGGVVGPEQASRNLQAIVEQLDPERLPRLGVADSLQSLRTDARYLFGQNGLCGVEFRVAELHNRHQAIKVISEEVRSAPGEVTLITGGPLSNLATLLQREADVATMIGHLIIVGGTLHAEGDVTAAAEFNIYCDAEAARLVIGSPITKTLLPRDVTSKVVFGLGVLEQLPPESVRTGRLLRALLPGAFRAYHQQLGLEGIYVPEAVAVAVALHPELIETHAYHCDVETGGELTHGATVIDRRRTQSQRPNLTVATEIDAQGAYDCILRGLDQAK
jgi:purine nucleosidase